MNSARLVCFSMRRACHAVARSVSLRIEPTTPQTHPDTPCPRYPTPSVLTCTSVFRSVLEWLRRPAGEESDDDMDGYEAIEPSSPLGSFTGSFTSALSHPHSTAATTPSPAHAPLQPPPQPPQQESGHTDDGKDDPAAVAKSLEFVTEAVTAAEVAAVVALSERTRAAMLPLPPHDRYFTLLRFVRARDGHVGKVRALS